MEDNDYVKLTKMEIDGRDSVEVDMFASKETLATMIFSAMCSNPFFSKAVILATESYYNYVADLDTKAKLN